MPCPKCGNRLEAITHEPALKILKNRCWHVCTSETCRYSVDAEKFKKTLWSV